MPSRDSRVPDEQMGRKHTNSKHIWELCSLYISTSLATMQPFMKKWTYMHCIVLFFLKLQCLACNLHGVKTGRNILTWFAICRWYAGWSSSRCLQGGVALSQGASDLLTGESRVSHFLDFLIFVKLASLQQLAMPFTSWFLSLWVKLYLQYIL